MTAFAVSGLTARARFERLADGVAAAAAVSLPWSTSLTSILIGIWLVCLLPTIDFGSFWRDTLRSPAAFLPLALVALVLLGMMWAHVPLRERLAGAGPYVKLIVVPLLLWQFSRRDSAQTVLWVFLASCTLLLVLSWLMAMMPEVSSLMPGRPYGIPVKDYITQSGVFTLCFFGLTERAIFFWKQSRRHSLLLVFWAAAFLANMVFIASSRTSLVVIYVLVALLGIIFLSRKGALVLLAAVVALTALSWTASSYLRLRVGNVSTEIETFTPTHDTSSGARLSFWKNSLSIISDAPLMGHGTGSTKAMFAKMTGGDATAPGAASNPHNQVFAIAIPLGIVGVLLLIAMWGAHVRLFWARDFAAWVGLSVVVQNIISSMFNSHLIDFTQGWLYVLGVGVAGGMVLRARAMASHPASAPP
jgi:O-antigen ligase